MSTIGVPKYDNQNKKQDKNDLNESRDVQQY